WAGRVDDLNERRQSQDVREQDEFLPFRVALLAGRGEEIDRGPPLARRQLRLGRERVQMADECGQQLTQPRLRGRGESGEHLSGQLAGGQRRPASWMRLWRLRSLGRHYGPASLPVPAASGSARRIRRR